jgi:predicted histone-like DNA-binding protein
MTFDEFVQHMHQHHSVFSEANIKGVITEMENCLRELLLDGKAVRLGTLGIFRIGIKTTGTQKLSDWNAKYNVKGARVNLYLGKRFRNLFQDLKISETAKNAIGVEDEDDDAVVNP